MPSLPMRLGTAAHSDVSHATGSRSIDRLTAATDGCSSACAATSWDAPGTGAHTGSRVAAHRSPGGRASRLRRHDASSVARRCARACGEPLSHTIRHCDDRRGDDAVERKRTNQGPRPGSPDPDQREHDDRLDGAKGDEDQECGLGALHLAGHAIQRTPASPGAVTTSGGHRARRIARARPSVTGAGRMRMLGRLRRAGHLRCWMRRGLGRSRIFG